jgi:hypothetical protein
LVVKEKGIQSKICRCGAVLSPSCQYLIPERHPVLAVNNEKPRFDTNRSGIRVRVLHKTNPLKLMPVRDGGRGAPISILKPSFLACSLVNIRHLT